MHSEELLPSTSLTQAENGRRKLFFLLLVFQNSALNENTTARELTQISDGHLLVRERHARHHFTWAGWFRDVLGDGA